MRDSPALAIIETLQEAGIAVRASDPQGLEHAQYLLENVDLIADPYDAVRDADAVVIATEWAEFRALDLHKIKALMRGSTFVDLRNLFDTADLDAAGFDHVGIGRPPSEREEIREEKREIEMV